MDIGADHKLVYQLFADDTGIFFEATEESFKAVMEVLRQFEKISRAKINIDKSKLIQLDLGDQPDWFSRSGCTVVNDRQVIKYLGCPFGRRLT